MGINAAAVYDVKTHATVILRTSSLAPVDRQKVLDSIASFAQHCESLAGIARSPLHVTALWGGPPYIAYELALSRFRTMVLWDEDPHDFDLAHDVHSAVVRLHSVVQKLGERFVRGEPDAFATVYHEAGCALLAQRDAALPRLDFKSSPQRSKLWHRSASSPPDTPVEARVENDDSSHPRGRLISRLSSAFRGSSKPSRKDKEARAPEAAPTKQSLRSSSSGLDDEVGSLALPDEFFLWCDFGPQLQENNDADLTWLLDLAILDPPVRIQSATQFSNRPSMRGDSVPSTPLTIPSSTSPLSPTQSGPSSVSPVAASIASAQPSSKNITRNTGSALDSTRLTVSKPLTNETTKPVQKNLATVVNSGNTSQGISTQSVMAKESSTSATPEPERSTSSHELKTGSQGTEMRSPVLEDVNAQVMKTGPSGTEDKLAVAASLPKAQDVSKTTGDFDVSELGTVKDKSAGEEEGEHQAVRMRMNEFALTMQSGNFHLALQQVVDTLRYLATQTRRLERETVTCANYVLALKILMRNSVVEAELQRTINGSPDATRRLVECAILSMFLAEIKHLLPRHRVAAMKVAVEKNLAVGNYGMCARWLRQLAEKAPHAQQQGIMQKLQMCAMNGERNMHMPPTNRLCFSSLQVVGSPYGKCNVCEAVFHATMSGVVEGQTCDICFVGKIHRLQTQ